MKIVNLIYQKLFTMLNHPTARRISMWILPYRAWIIIFVHIFLFGLSYTISMIMLKNPAELDLQTSLSQQSKSNTNSETLQVISQ